jgi:hypothetical protein
MLAGERVGVQRTKRHAHDNTQSGVDHRVEIRAPYLRVVEHDAVSCPLKAHRQQDNLSPKLCVRL